MVTATPPLLVVLVGSTGSGKTALSLNLAQRLGGEIVSCDSVAVYRGLDLGAAKPTAAERTRIPHHLLDVADPSEPFTAGDYSRLARLAIHAIAARGNVPIVAGGTGLYLRALLDGLSPVPPRDEALRQRLQRIAHRRGGHALHRILRRIDPAAAARIHTNDAPKLIRAIEITLLAQRPMTEAVAADPPQPLLGFRIVKLGLAPPRDVLYRRIDARCERMFADGLLDETRSLLNLYGNGCRALTSLGYAQACAVLQGTLTPAAALAATQQGHRNYSKRQGTWFRKDPAIRWLPSTGETCLDEALHLIETEA